MTPKEAAYHQLKNLQGKPFKEKIKHIALYYWKSILLVLVALIILITQAVRIVTQKDTVLSICCINSSSAGEGIDTHVQNFAAIEGIDLNKHTISVSTGTVFLSYDLSNTYESSQILFSQIASGTLDLIMCDQDTLLSYFDQDELSDLSLFFNPDQLSSYSDLLIYGNADSNAPIAILLPSGSEFVKKCYPYAADQVVLAVVSNSPNLDVAFAFLNYTLK